VSRWEDAFRLVGRSRTRNTKRTVGADVTVWRGTVKGTRFTVRVTPRPRYEGLSFLVTSNHRLRDGEGTALSGEEFLDVEVLQGPVAGPAAEALLALIADADARAGTGRRARLRRRGERFRIGVPMGDALAHANTSAAALALRKSQTKERDDEEVSRAMGD
jgi:hypothetical protein